MIAANATTVDAAGMVLEGAYRLVRLIGQGGMGAVYEAVQLRLNKHVAVKLMSREAACDMVSLERFRREAEITSKLGHPHLVNMVDFGTAESGQPYLVMEYLEGEDLDQRLQKAICLPVDNAARIAIQAASALGAAHAQDVVHRDLKPANIFLLQVPGEPDFVKVLDFGISKVKAANGRRLTGVQSVVGTPAYMSPEQAMGRTDDTDHRADQWALACIVWEMLCGHPPFMADDTNALFFQIIRIDPSSLIREVPDLHPAAETVLRRALSKRHVDRYPSIREFARAFEMAALGWATEATPPPVCVPIVSETNSPRRSTPNSADRAVTVEDQASTGANRESGQAPAQATSKLPKFKLTGWRLLAVSAMTAAVVAAAGTLALRSPSVASGTANAPVPRADVRALPASSTIATLPPGNATEFYAVEKPVKDKMERSAKAPARTAGKAKRAPAKAQIKHRLFEEL